MAVILKGVIKGLRRGLATCRFLYIASIGSAPSISLYGLGLYFLNRYIVTGSLKSGLSFLN
jgi:hypothetical protein